MIGFIFALFPQFDAGTHLALVSYGVFEAGASGGELRVPANTEDVPD